MIQAVVIALLAAVASTRSLHSTPQTWVTNDSDTDVVASLHYMCFDTVGHSKFIDRAIKAHSLDHDQYGQIHDGAGNCKIGVDPYLNLVIRESTANNVGTFKLDPNESVVIQNGQPGLNVYRAKFGSLHVTEGAPLGQIFDN